MEFLKGLIVGIFLGQLLFTLILILVYGGTRNEASRRDIESNVGE